VSVRQQARQGVALIFISRAWKARVFPVILQGVQIQKPNKKVLKDEGNNKKEP
jgi:hypothetical protein